MNIRESILSCNDTALEPCPIPEWGEAGKKIHIRVMPGEERDAWEAETYLWKENGDEAAVYRNCAARLAVRCCCDENGVPIFTASDAEALGKRSSVPLRRIFDAALRLNKLRKKDIEELTKNSRSGANVDSGSASLSPSTKA